MSHYSVAVIHRKNQDVDELLAPFDESIKVEPYVEFSKDEAIYYARRHFEVQGKTDEECWKIMASGKKTDEDGNIYSTYNPKSKWDWYFVEDEIPVSDIKTDIDEKEYESCLRFWDVYVEHEPLREGEDEDDFVSFFSEEYFKEKFLDRETYAKANTLFSTYAVITSDGEWHSPGDVIWFGVSTESGEKYRDWVFNYKERFLNDPNMIMTIVNCHI